MVEKGRQYTHMSNTNTVKSPNPVVQELFEVGAHYGLSKARRHPSAKEHIFGTKNTIDIIDLEATALQLQTALEAVKKLAEEGKQVLFVSSKFEARKAIENGAESIDQPYVAGRWIGGTLTNFAQMRKRVERFESIKTQKEKGELSKYTKKERLLLDREAESLESKFGGVSGMAGMPGALFIVDLKKEHNAVREAKAKNIPIISLSGTDCDHEEARFPILANDASRKSIEYFVSKVVETYKNTKK